MFSTAKRAVVIGTLLSRISRLREETNELSQAAQDLAFTRVDRDGSGGYEGLQTRYAAVVDELIDTQFFINGILEAIDLSKDEFDVTCGVKWMLREMQGKNKATELRAIVRSVFGAEPVATSVGFGPGGRVQSGTPTDKPPSFCGFTFGDTEPEPDGSRFAQVMFGELKSVAGRPVRVRKENSTGPDLGAGEGNASNGDKGASKGGLIAGLSSDDAATLVRLFEACAKDIRGAHNL